MNIEQQLSQVADRYREQGYQVSIRPGPDDLPSFAKDFKVDILARRADGNVLVSTKASPSELEADSNLSRYAETVEKQHGWRYDLFVLGPAPEATSRNRDAKEPSEEELHRFLSEAERMDREGFHAQALIAAWAALESVMRHSLREQGSEAGWGTSPRTMLNELVSSGMLSSGEFRVLEGYFQLRNIIVHGFSPPAIEPGAVQSLVSTARRLLAVESPVIQTV